MKTPRLSALSVNYQTDTTPPVLDNFIVSFSSFSPNGDERRDFIKILYKLSEPSKVFVKIYNETGEMVKDLWPGGVARDAGWNVSYLYGDEPPSFSYSLDRWVGMMMEDR